MFNVSKFLKPVVVGLALIGAVTTANTIAASAQEINFFTIGTGGTSYTYLSYSPIVGQV